MRRWSRVLATIGFAFFGASSASAQELPSNPPLAILLAAGDIAKCTDKGVDEATAKILLTEIEAAKKAGVRVHVLAIGDLAYDGGTAANFKCFGESWGRPEIYPHLLPVPGNHDVQTHADAKPYYEFFAKLPIITDHRARGGYYAVEIASGDRPAWRIYGLNAYVGMGTSSAQLKWLDADLRDHPATCVLAFWHPFLFSSGHHGHGRSKNPNAPTKRLADAVPPFRVLHRHGATVLLTAHDHVFEQFGRHDAEGKAAADGVRSFVIGTGGAPLYRSVVYETKAPNSEVYDQDTHGVLRVELFPERYKWSFLPIEGKEPIALEPNEERCNERKPG